MKVMWVCNIVLPEAGEVFGIKPDSTGGWISGLADSLIRNEGIELVICFTSNFAKTLEKRIKGKVVYWNVPKSVRSFHKPDVKSETYFKEILNIERPDIVNIFGSETPYTNAVMNVSPLEKTIITIQGLISHVAMYYPANLTKKVINGWTLRDLVKKENVLNSQKKFFIRGRYEKAAFKKTKYVIGRTSWDKSSSFEMNPLITYFHCEEVLRQSFYTGFWNQNNCEKYSIFVSQGNAPYKCLHNVIKALPGIIKRYPSAHLYIAGSNPQNNSGFFGQKRSYYANYILYLIRENNLESNITFLGNLDEKAMHDRYLRSNVFLSASSIENSSNSICEAMILGVPVVASFVGGVPDLLAHNVDGFLYPYDEENMITYYVNKLFDNPKMQLIFSRESRQKALLRHDKQSINECLLEIYRKVIENRL